MRVVGVYGVSGASVPGFEGQQPRVDQEAPDSTCEWGPSCNLLAVRAAYAGEWTDVEKDSDGRGIAGNLGIQPGSLYDHLLFLIQPSFATQFVSDKVPWLGDFIASM